MLTFIYRLYQLIVVVPLALLSTFVTALVTSVGCIVGHSAFWSYWPGRLWGATMCRLCLFPVHVEGRENLKPGQIYVFMSNHQGAFDIFLIYGFLHRPFKWMMKQSLRKVPFVGYACKCAGFIFVDRNSPTSIQHTMEQSRKILKNGMSLMIFPEGSRTKTGEIGRFKKGGFVLAEEVGLPIVPMTIDGPFQVLPPQKGLSFVKWHRLTIKIHPAVMPGEGAMEKVREAIVNNK